MNGIVYAREQDLPVDDYVDVVGHSALGPTRPIADGERVAAMLAGTSLVVSARSDGRCVGIARCLADFAWVAYCADLAVHEDFQGRGIGEGLLRKCREILGDGVGMALISVPSAVPFYEKMGERIGLKPQGDTFWLPRTRGV
ncbi:MAG TPA: GNAT family N-acetyltransferase [Devosia sp.]